MKKIFSLLLIILTMIIAAPNVKASGTAELKWTKNPEIIKENETIELTLSLDNILNVNGGVAGINGEIIYNTNYLELISVESLAPFNISFANNRFIGFAIGNNITTTSSNLLKFTFKTLKSGETKINLKGVAVGDSKSQKVDVIIPEEIIRIESEF